MVLGSKGERGMMSSKDPWEQLSALEKRASKRAGNDRFAAVENGSACGASEVSTSGNGESGENFQVNGRDLYKQSSGYSLAGRPGLRGVELSMPALPQFNPSSCYIILLTAPHEECDPHERRCCV